MSLINRVTQGSIKLQTVANVANSYMRLFLVQRLESPYNLRIELDIVAYQMRYHTE